MNDDDLQIKKRVHLLMNLQNTIFIITLLMIVLLKITKIRRMCIKYLPTLNTQYSKNLSLKNRPVIYSRYNDIYKEMEDLYIGSGQIY